MLYTNIEYTEAGNSEKIKKPANIDVYLTYESGDTIVQGDVNLRFCEGTYLNALQNLIKSLIAYPYPNSNLPFKFKVNGPK